MEFLFISLRFLYLVPALYLLHRNMFLISLYFGITNILLHIKLLQSIEIYKRVGAFAMALETINKCLSDAICAMSRGRLDGDSRAAALIYSGNDVLEAFKYSSEAR